MCVYYDVQCRGESLDYYDNLLTTLVVSLISPTKYFPSLIIL